MKGWIFFKGLILGLSISIGLVCAGAWYVVQTYQPLVESVNQLEQKIINQRPNLENLSQKELDKIKELLEDKTNKSIQISIPVQPKLSKIGNSMILYGEDLGLSIFKAKILGEKINNNLDKKSKNLKIRKVFENDLASENLPIPKYTTGRKRKYLTSKYKGFTDIFYFRRNQQDKSLIDIILLNIATNAYTVTIVSEEQLFDFNYFNSFVGKHKINTTTAIEIDLKGTTLFYPYGGISTKDVTRYTEYFMNN